jgi:proteasome lid subunit RPN8/RPN11
MTITDETTEDIDQAIAKPPPELEGLLFGPIHRDIVTPSVADNTAATNTATYEIYSDMCSRAPEKERDAKLQYKGILHSHPVSFDSASGGDGLSAANALRVNLTCKILHADRYWATTGVYASA